MSSKQCQFISPNNILDWKSELKECFFPKDIFSIIWHYLLPEFTPGAIVVAPSRKTVHLKLANEKESFFYQIKIVSHCKNHGWVYVCKRLKRSGFYHYGFSFNHLVQPELRTSHKSTSSRLMCIGIDKEGLAIYNPQVMYFGNTEVALDL